MKAVVLREPGSDDPVEVGALPMPAPKQGEVVVRVRAAAVTPTELAWEPTWKLPTGEPRPRPIVPGHEFSGEIHALGADVRELSIGDPVLGMNDWIENGAQAEYCVARPSDIALKPRSIEYAVAATIPISGLTAWQGMVEKARVVRGARVLILGGAGAVGIFAVQLAHSLGAHVTATVSARDLDFVRGLGAEVALDYRLEWPEGAAGMDIVFDTVGGETLERAWGCLRPSGKMVTIAASSEQTLDRRTQDAFFIVEPNRSQLMKLAEMIASGRLQTFVGAQWPLEEAARAYRPHPAAGAPRRGKAVLVVGDAGR
ncbi:MAG: NADP-dependent oxidoreductase [Polyangiaceae bacterium]|nr:NADP-dependent oxidoreductase [Polyangiaceae bacterium]